MLKLRKILLCNEVYYIVFLIVILMTLIRINYSYSSHYQDNTKEVVGIITSIKEIDSKTTYEIKAKETLIATTSQKNKYQLGDKVIIKGVFQKPNSPTTKYLFNYEEYLKRKKIFYLIQIESITRIQKNKNIYYFLKQKIKNRLNNNAYLYTFILGDKSLVSKEAVRSYQENGISHLFAISGMHITLLSSMIERIIKNFFQEEKRYKIISLFLIGYLLLVGFSPSVVRGVLFYILFQGNKIYYFYIKKENLFILALSISLLLNPMNIFDIGFEYSYLISYALLKMQNSLTSNSKIISLLKTSIYSFFVSIPITLKNYYQLNFLSIIFNLFYVPFVSIILFPFTLVVFIFPFLEPLYNCLIILLEKSSIFLSKISLGKLLWKRVPFIIYILYFIVIILYLNKPKKILIYIFITLLSIHFIIPFMDSSDYMKVLDIGQGDSILIHSNHKNVLVDTGGVSYGEDGTIFYNTTYPILKMDGIKKIDYLIITHGDKDHIGEAKTLLDNMKVNKIILNCNELNYLEKEILNKKTILGEEGTSFQVGDFSFYQLNECMDNENDSSQVYIVNYKNIYNILLTGDASIKTEKTILQKYDLPEIDILKVGHHGSKTSSSKEFVDTINPKYSVISVGKNNKFGHPNKEVLEVLSSSEIYRTDEDGSILFMMKNNKIQIETSSS